MWPFGLSRSDEQWQDNVSASIGIMRGTLSTILTQLTIIVKGDQQTMATLTDVKTQVDAIKADVEALIAKVKDLAAQLAAAIANQADPAAIQAISDELTATAAEAEASLNPSA